MKAASLEKLPCLVDFPHISSIILYNLVSSDSFVPDQYLFSSINCLTFRAVSFTDKKEDLEKELIKIFDSAKKVGLPDKKVQRVIDKQKSKMSGSDNVVLNSSVEIPNNVSADAQSSFIILPFINKKLASKAKSFFHQLNFKVSFSNS